jgi:hypothetical protein
MRARVKFDAAMAECALHASVLAEAAAELPAAFSVDDVAGIDAGVDGSTTWRPCSASW